MSTYPLTKSQHAEATAEQVRSFVKSPTLIARRFSEILDAQQFLSLFLLTGRYQVQGGAIAVPKNETIRTVRGAATVAPGSEYKLTPLTAHDYEIFVSEKDGLATEITDEEITRSLMQPVEDAVAFLKTELIFSADDKALGVIQSSVTQSHAAAAAWTTGKQAFADAELVKAKTRRLRRGYKIDTAVLPGELFATVLPELIELLPSSADNALTGDFPTLGGITWVPDDTGLLTDPMFVDRSRLGGIGRERIQSPGYVGVGGDTGVEVKTFALDKSDATRIQARNPHVPVVTNPLAGWYVTGASA